MKKILLLMCAIAISWGSHAQDVTVSGTVTSAEDGSALPGVNVILKGTSTGTTTDSNGKYSLSVPASGGTLVLSFIGLKTQEVEIGGRTTINATLSLDATELSEVVVTALGIQRTKNELPYSAQQVDGSSVSQTRDNNFINSLSGKVSGLDIKRNNSLGGSTNVIIRGVKSLSGNNQALFIVDGVPIDNSNTNGSTQAQGGGGYDYGNSAADINPDDIESVNVLKGAAASALYGSRASNGVIMITTKKGKGAKGIGLTVNTGINFGSIDKDTFVAYQRKYGGGYGSFYEDPSGFFLYRDIDGNGTDDLVVPTSEDASWGAAFNPNLMVYQWDAFDPSSANYGKPRPWVAAKNDPSTFFEKPVSTNYSFLLDGASDRGYYKLGYTSNKEQGILPKSGLDKDFLNFGASFKMSDKLTATASVNISNQKGLGRYGTGYDGANGRNLMTNFRQWWQVNVDLKELEAAYNRTHKNVTWNWTDPSDLTGIYWDNPYWVRHENYQNDSRTRYFGYTALNYKVTNWLELMGRVTLDTYNEKQEERLAVGSVAVPSYSRFDRSFTEYNYDLMANFNKDLSEDFNLKAIIGTNIRKTKIESILSRTNGGLVVPRLYSISNSLNQINAPTESFSELGVYGYFAGVTLGYKDMLFLDLTERVDQASSLPEGNNTFSYPSVSGSFVFSELLDNVQWLTGAKVRANYAQVGGSAAPNSTKDVYDKPTPFGSSPLFSIPGTKNNPELKPESTTSIEVGLEMSFLDGRTGFDVSYYKTNTVDQILPVPVSRATGYNSKFINSGEVENKGIELSAFGTPVKTDDFSWTINVNWTRNRNEVIALAEGIDNLQIGTYQAGVSINAALGEPYGTIRGNSWLYHENGGKIVNPSGYYRFSSTSNEVIGNINPDWIGGINNKVTYKGLSLSFLIDIKKGGDVFNLDLYYGLATGLYEETAGVNEFGNPVRSAPADFGSGQGGVLIPGVKDDGTPNDVRYNATSFGIYGYRRNPAAAFVYDASYVKLRELILTYSIPQSITSKLGPVKGIDLSFVGRNLWIIDKNLPHADPEDGLGSGLLANGYQVGTYPNVRNLGFNLKLKF